MPLDKIKKATYILLCNKQAQKNRTLQIRRRNSESDLLESYKLHKTTLETPLQRRHSWSSTREHVLYDDPDDFKRRQLQIEISAPHKRFFKGRFVQTGRIEDLASKLAYLQKSAKGRFEGFCARIAFFALEYSLTGDIERFSQYVTDEKPNFGKHNVLLLIWLKKNFNLDLFQVHGFRSSSRQREFFNDFSNAVFSKSSIELKSNFLNIPEKSTALIFTTGHVFSIIRDGMGNFYIGATGKEKNDFSVYKGNKHSNKVIPALSNNEPDEWCLLKLTASEFKNKVDVFIKRIQSRESFINVVSIKNNETRVQIANPDLDVQVVPHPATLQFSPHKRAISAKSKIAKYFRKPFPSGNVFNGALNKNTIDQISMSVLVSKIHQFSSRFFFITWIPEYCSPAFNKIASIFSMLAGCWGVEEILADHNNTWREVSSSSHEIPELIAVFLGVLRLRTSSISMQISALRDGENQRLIKRISSLFGETRAHAEIKYWKSIKEEKKHQHTMLEARQARGAELNAEQENKLKENIRLEKHADQILLKTVERVTADAEHYEALFAGKMQESTAEDILNTITYASRGEIFMLGVDEDSFFITKTTQGELVILDEKNINIENASKKDIEKIAKYTTYDQRKKITQTVLNAKRIIFLQFKKTSYPKVMTPYDYALHQTQEDSDYFLKFPEQHLTTTRKMFFNTTSINDNDGHYFQSFHTVWRKSKDPNIFNMNVILDFFFSSLEFNENGNAVNGQYKALEWDHNELSINYFKNILALHKDGNFIQYNIFSKETTLHNDSIQKELREMEGFIFSDFKKNKQFIISKIQMVTNLFSLINSEISVLIVNSKNALLLRRSEGDGQLELLDKANVLESVLGSKIRSDQYDFFKVPGFYVGENAEGMVKKLFEHPSSKTFETIQLCS